MGLALHLMHPTKPKQDEATFAASADGGAFMQAAAMLAAHRGVQDLLYEVVWREQELAEGMPAADFLASPAAVTPQIDFSPVYLRGEGVEVEERAAFAVAAEQLTRAYILAALECLGWQRQAGTTIDPEELRLQLGIIPEHRRLLRRMLVLLTDAGMLTSLSDSKYKVAISTDDRLPAAWPNDADEWAARLEKQHQHALNELGLLRRCGNALAQVLCGKVDPLTLLFPESGLGAADVYRNSPSARAMNRMTSDVVKTTVANLPEGRQLRVLEVDAGTGATTARVLSTLPAGRFHYTFTDISASFFSEAEARFTAHGAAIAYRALNVEEDPVAQGFRAHSYDLVIAANVLHATKDLGASLANCHKLLAPSGQLLALERMVMSGWLDITYGLLDGWWRFDDTYRPEHALAAPQVWRQVFKDTGYGDVEILGADSPESNSAIGQRVIVAQGAAEVAPEQGLWVLVTDRAAGWQRGEKRS